MASVSGFIAVPPSKPDFRVFQQLPELVRDALVWGTKEQDAGKLCCERDVATFLIEHYDVNQVLLIGTLLEEMSRFLNHPDKHIHGRMERCFVDHGCNMVRAKLAWRDDY